MKVFTLMIQKNSKVPFDDPNGISMGSIDFDSPKVYGDTSIFDCLVSTHKIGLALDNDTDLTYDYFNSHDRVGP